MGGSKERVRALNAGERKWVIDECASDKFWVEFRSELWKRSRNWRRLVLATASGTLGFVAFGEELVTKLSSLFRALGWL